MLFLPFYKRHKLTDFRNLPTPNRINPMKFMSGVIKVLEIKDREKTFSRQSEKKLSLLLENNDLKVDKLYFRNK